MTHPTIAVRLSPYQFDSSRKLDEQPDRKRNFAAVRMLEDGFVFDDVLMKYRQGNNGTGSLVIDGAGWKTLMARIFGFSERQQARLDTYLKLIEQTAIEHASSGAPRPTTFEEQLAANHFKISQLKGGFSIGERTYEVAKDRGKPYVVETTSTNKQFFLLFMQSREEFAQVGNTVNAIKLGLEGLHEAKRELKAARASPVSSQSVRRLLDDPVPVLRLDELDDARDELLPLDEKIRKAAEAGIDEISYGAQNTSSSQAAERTGRYAQKRSVPALSASLREKLLNNIAADMDKRRFGEMTVGQFTAEERMRQRDEVDAPEH
ncbi:hypothetical protein SCB29_29160 [Paraburkholderia sp. SIMBA_055]